MSEKQMSEPMARAVARGDTEKFTFTVAVFPSQKAELVEEGKQQWRTHAPGGLPRGWTDRDAIEYALNRRLYART